MTWPSDGWLNRGTSKHLRGLSDVHLVCIRSTRGKVLDNRDLGSRRLLCTLYAATGYVRPPDHKARTEEQREWGQELRAHGPCQRRSFSQVAWPRAASQWVGVAPAGSMAEAYCKRMNEHGAPSPRNAAGTLRREHRRGRTSGPCFGMGSGGKY